MLVAIRAAAHPFRSVSLFESILFIAFAAGMTAVDHDVGARNGNARILLHELQVSRSGDYELATRNEAAAITETVE